MFTLRQMRYFDALATTLHFGEAAQRVGVSQPALSVQISEMEKAAGAPLFERLPKTVALTVLGQQIYPVICDILKEVISLDEVLQLRDRPFQGALRLGIIPTVAPYLLPVVLPLLAEHYPNLSFQVREEKTDDLAEDLAHGRIDVVIAAEPFPFTESALQILFFDPFLMATSARRPHYVAESLNQDEIDISRLMLLEEGHCLRDQALEACRTQQYKRDIAVSSLTTLLQLVANDLGETVIPKSAISVENKNNMLKTIPFADPQLGRTLALYWRRSSRLHKDYKALGKFLAGAFANFEHKR